MNTTNERLAALELEITHCRRSARRDRSIAAGLAGVLALVVMGASGQPQKEKLPEEFRVKKLLLVNAQGETRAALGLLQDGAPRLDLFDENAKVRLSVGLAKGGTPELDLNDEKSENRAVLGLLRDGSPTLEFHDERKKLRSALSLSSDGSPALILSDEKGVSRAIVGTAKPTLPDGTKAAHAGSMLTVFGTDGKVFWKAPDEVKDVPKAPAK